MGKRLHLGRFSILVKPNHVWVGVFVHASAFYIALLPCLVIRWDRSNGGAR